MQLNEFIDRLFERAQAAGFSDYEAYYSDGDEFEVTVFQGEIAGYTVSSSMGLNFRGMFQGNMGYASTQVLDEQALDMLVESARQNALIIEDTDQQFIFPGSERYPDLPGANPRIAEISEQQKIEWALELEKAALSLDERVKQVQSCVLATVSGTVRIKNSKGLDVSHSSNALEAYISVVARQGDKVSTGSDLLATHEVEDLNIREMANRAVKEAVEALSARPVASGEYKVVLKNDAAADLLGTFSGIFSAESAQKGLSLLKGREGQRIASPNVTLMDNPHHPTALGSAPFDDEGVATTVKAVIDKGVLTTLLHNLKTANKQGVQTTGNAAKGSYASPVGVAPGNFYFEPSQTSLDELIAEMGNGLLITDLQGLHAGANGISGDFSLGAKGYLVEGGKIGRAVDQITVAGNFYQMLNVIEKVASDLKFGFGRVGSPSIRVSGLSVAGQ